MAGISQAPTVCALIGFIEVMQSNKTASYQKSLSRQHRKIYDVREWRCLFFPRMLTDDRLWTLHDLFSHGIFNSNNVFVVLPDNLNVSGTKPQSNCFPRDQSLRVESRPNDRNISTQHIATLLGVRLATLLWRVGCCWLKFENRQIQVKNTNMSQQGGQTSATCCA